MGRYRVLVLLCYMTDMPYVYGAMCFLSCILSVSRQRLTRTCGCACAAVHAAVHSDAAGFRAYISPAREACTAAGLKRKAPDGAAPFEPPMTRGCSLASGRTASGMLLEVRSGFLP